MSAADYVRMEKEGVRGRLRRLETCVISLRIHVFVSPLFYNTVFVTLSPFSSVHQPMSKLQ